MIRRNNPITNLLHTKVIERQQQQALIPNFWPFWGWQYILNRLIRAGHMYSFFHSILSEVIFFVKVIERHVSKIISPTCGCLTGRLQDKSETIKNYLRKIRGQLGDWLRGITRAESYTSSQKLE